MTIFCYISLCLKIFTSRSKRLLFAEKGVIK